MNPDAARDVVPDTSVKLMARPIAEAEGHLAEWLFRVCRHRALKVYEINEALLRLIG